MTTTLCIECHCEIPADSELCPECGFPARPGLVNCPECLHPVLLALDACPECGFPLSEVREAQATAASLQGGPSVDRPDAPAFSRSIPVASGSVPGPTDAPHSVSDQVLRSQIESLNLLTAAIGGMMENSNSAAINELVVSIRNFVNTSENTNNDMLSDLITNIARFVENSEKIKDDMLNGMKEQSLLTTSAVQEIVTSFSNELRTAATGMQEAQQATLAEMNGVSQQIKTAALTQAEEAGGSEGSPYLLYICAVLIVFSILNFFVTAYVVRLVK